MIERTRAAARLAAALALSALVGAGAPPAQAGPVRGTLGRGVGGQTGSWTCKGNRSHAAIPRFGPGGPPPLGAAGFAPVGAAGPAPLGAAGPPPLGAAGSFAHLPGAMVHGERDPMRDDEPCCPNLLPDGENPSELDGSALD